MISPVFFEKFCLKFWMFVCFFLSVQRSALLLILATAVVSERKQQPSRLRKHYHILCLVLATWSRVSENVLPVRRTHRETF